MAAAAASLIPAASSSILRRPRSAARLLLLRRPGNPRTASAASLRTTQLTTTHGPPSPRLLGRLLAAAPSSDHLGSRWRLFCSAAVSADAETREKVGALVAGEKVREFKKRLRIADVKGGPDEGVDRLGEVLIVRGWIRTCRVQSTVTFIEVNDGSCLSNMQCVMSSDAEGYDQIESGLITTGTSVLVEGTVVSSQGTKQKVELKVARLIMIGKSDPSTYPIQKKRATREFLRTIAHLRPRTNTFSAVTRVRNALAYATHNFFQENGFVWVSSPIITASDCEGAGEQFCVTTLIPNAGQGDCPLKSIPSTKDGNVDWSQDFFGRPAFLTVSGQLNAETYATALSDVYTFGPTFRAENSNTSRHLAEFWMIEPELAFADLNDDMACATAYLQ
ncbi:asparagine--tRNA ligase, chloroplastic/mitochondrial [Canna indica]|uniref:Asparagine--tRNA ligase, chloroplastic/mitochondrial n=1 Tax=Canna indica TaxID=4628 RepID=A0AAQ3KKB1_9LILI|nr:asparagine--tRNA ligase, chloroplastic/mitochondrial [Canna indica]